MKLSLYKTIPKMIKARQLQEIQQFIDQKTGQKFIGQIGDWKVYDQNGYTFIMGYHQFIERYYPADTSAFDCYSRKQEVKKKKTVIMDNLKQQIKQLNNYY